MTRRKVSLDLTRKEVAQLLEVIKQKNLPHLYEKLNQYKVKLAFIEELQTLRDWMGVIVPYNEASRRLYESLNNLEMLVHRNIIREE